MRSVISATVKQCALPFVKSAQLHKRNMFIVLNADHFLVLEPNVPLAMLIKRETKFCKALFVIFVD